MARNYIIWILKNRKKPPIALTLGKSYNDSRCVAILTMAGVLCEQGKLE